MGDANAPCSTTLDQRRKLVAIYQRTHNMAKAAREAGIRSRRTAYLWWRRYEAEGDAGLVPRSRARKTQRTTPEDVADVARALRRAHPEWGRRRIARELHAQCNGNVLSPSGVQAVLERGGLWRHAARPMAEPDPRNAARVLRPEIRALEALLPRVVSGIVASLASEAAESVAVLGGEVWRRLGADRREWSRLLDDPAVGPLLLRSRVELGRSLMNTGQSREAVFVLDETLGWLRRAERRFGGEEDNDPWLGIRLRRDDAWIETYQYLGILPRPGRTYEPHYLNFAIAAIQPSARRLVPLHPALIAGNLERDLARQLLRNDTSPDSDIARHLHASRAALAETEDVAMMAATDMVWAKLESRRARRASGEDTGAWAEAIASMEALTEHALAVFETMDSPMLHANFLVDAARLAAVHGLPVDRRRLQNAAELCVAFGYGGQARLLLGLPGVAGTLPLDLLQGLSRLTPGTPVAEKRPDRKNDR